MVRTLGSLFTEDHVQPLVLELRSQKLLGVAKKKQCLKKKKTMLQLGGTNDATGGNKDASQGGASGGCLLAPVHKARTWALPGPGAWKEGLGYFLG